MLDFPEDYISFLQNQEKSKELLDSTISEIELIYKKQSTVKWLSLLLKLKYSYYTDKYSDNRVADPEYLINFDKDINYSITEQQKMSVINDFQSYMVNKFDINDHLVVFNTYPDLFSYFKKEDHLYFQEQLLQQLDSYNSDIFFLDVFTKYLNYIVRKPYESNNCLDRLLIFLYLYPNNIKLNSHHDASWSSFIENKELLNTEKITFWCCLKYILLKQVSSCTTHSKLDSNWIILNTLYPEPALTIQELWNKTSIFFNSFNSFNYNEKIWD